MKAIRFYYHRQSSIYLNAAAFATMVFRCVDDILLYVETITLLGNGETYSLLVCVCVDRGKQKTAAGLVYLIMAALAAHKQLIISMASNAFDDRKI